MKSSEETIAEFEEALASPQQETYVLRLYVSGASPKSARAIAKVKHMCETHLIGRYDLEVIDIYQKPSLAVSEQIVAVPTLVKKLPRPLQRLIGDMSQAARILLGQQ